MRMKPSPTRLRTENASHVDGLNQAALCGTNKKPSLPNKRATNHINGEIDIGRKVGRAPLKIDQVARAVDGESGQRDLRLTGGWRGEQSEPGRGGVVGARCERRPWVAPVLVLEVARGQLGMMVV